MKDILEKLKDKKILILGFGREGISTFKFIRKYYPKVRIYIADKNQVNLPEDKNINAFFGENYLDNLSEFDLIVKTPGISSESRQIKDCIKEGVEVTSQTQLFLECFRDKTIGVTGTKGKSTTISLIYNILKEAGIKIQMVGNIGKPVLDYVNEDTADDLFVYEMSSHQLSDIKESPHLSIFLNIYSEHLDYYSTFDKYVQAKANITKYQKASDVFIYNYDQEDVREVSKISLARKFVFSIKENVVDGCYLDGDEIIFVEKGIRKYEFDAKKVRLQGKHNRYNLMAAVIATRTLGVDFNEITKGIESFIPLEGRLEVVGVIDGVTFINDTLATIPQATIAALESLGDRRITLILGGFDRGIDFSVLGNDIAQRGNVLNVVTLGQTGPKIEKALRENKFSGKIVSLGNAAMGEVVKKANQITPKRGIILLSPASTSFDMFKDYKDRGDQFKKAVLWLKK